MSASPIARRSLAPSMILVAAVLVTACTRASPPATNTPAPLPAEVRALIDRAAIENRLVDYYSHIGAGESFDFSAFFTDDGVLDVNGLVAQGRDQILDLYRRAGSGEAPPARDDSVPPGRFHMALTNVKIEVAGAAATADVLWTSFHTESLITPPQLEEQGRDHTEWVERDGRWLIARRTVTSDSGMPKGLLSSYVER
jgi:hypothetical protein